jgi:hypothetical protein
MSQEKAMSEAAIAAKSVPRDLPQAPAALRRALVEAIARRRRRIRTGIVTGCAATIAVAAALTTGLSGTQPPKALAIQTTGNWIEVRIVNADNAEAVAMTQQLREAGLNIDVRVMPAPPSLVGDWMGIRDLDDPPPNFDPDAPTDPAPAPLLGPGEQRMTNTLFAVRRDVVDRFEGRHFVLYVGRATQPGERPEMLFGDGPHPVDPNDPTTPLSSN